jgi:hypothetical protein
LDALVGFVGDDKGGVVKVEVNTKEAMVDWGGIADVGISEE